MTTDLTYAVLDLSDDSLENSARVHGYAEAVLRAFNEGRSTQEWLDKWLRTQRADSAVVRGVWDATTAPLAGQMPVATFGHFTKTLNTGRALMPVRMITDVTVAPTHRRRGIMRTLMTDCLTEIVDEGIPAAVLTASEGSIYQRFGFGVTAREARISLDTTSRFRMRPRPSDGGRVVMADIELAWESMARVFADFHATSRGSVDRPHFYEDWLRGYDWDAKSEDLKQRIALRLNANGDVDGYLAYQVKSGEPSEVSVQDLISLTPAAYLDLWQFVADIDLTGVATASLAPVDPLPLALENPRVVSTKGISDNLWIRILDVVGALEQRPWFADGSVVLGVSDPLGFAEGTFAIAVRDGVARVTPSDAAPEIVLDVETLATLYLGDVRVETLHRAGRLSAPGGEEALTRWGALSDGGPIAHCRTHF